ncbi:ABC transporter permease [Mangrovactinospora gilvigrisea]|uniref:ABC transporter permease n=2 Tax=Mangrovactinospora gilvigrisea TaxID=1428644 RepID=A0A1J7BD72_9ACTN|nr:ABC transporter permease [Mangrovactinospora gilvigrisea]
MEKPRRTTTGLKALLLVLVVVMVAYPLVYILAVSLSASGAPVGDGLVLWPGRISFDAYRTVLNGGIVTRALLISIGVTVVGTLIAMVFTVAMAYGLTRTKDVPGSRFILYLVLGTMLFGAGIIPNFLLVKSLGMVNTYWSLMIPGAISAFNLVVVRNFFMEIPKELYDAARIDGAGELQILWRVVLPLSKAVLAVISLFYAVALWSDFFNALLYLNDTSKWPIQLVMRQYVLEGTSLGGLSHNPNAPQPPSHSVQMAVTVLATIPILIVYPFLQRYFTRGVLVGAVKG